MSSLQPFREMLWYIAVPSQHSPTVGRVHHDEGKAAIVMNHVGRRNVQHKVPCNHA